MAHWIGFRLIIRLAGLFAQEVSVLVQILGIFAVFVDSIRILYQICYMEIECSLMQKEDISFGYMSEPYWGLRS